MTLTTSTDANRAWGTKSPPEDAAHSTFAETDAVSWGDPGRTGTAFDFRSESHSGARL